MKNRNYLSIEYQNNILTPKLILRPLNRYYFNPQKTFSNFGNFNNHIINLKTAFGKMISLPDNKGYNTLFISSKDQNSNLSKRNTYYKTNNFSPQSTVNTFSSKYSFIKEKYSRNKNSQISLKQIEFNTDKSSSRNNLPLNNTKFIFVGNKDSPKRKIIQKKDNVEHNIELSGQNLINNTINNKINNTFNNTVNSTINNSVKSKYKKTIINNRTDINNSIDFFRYPNFKLTKKSKSNKILNYKEKRENNYPKFKNINVKKSLEEYNEKISEYNYDNYRTNANKHSINTLYLNENKDKKVIIQLKTRKNTDNNEIIIEEIDNKKNNKEKIIDKNLPKKIKNYELEADIRMFDPITLKSNENLSKDFLMNKEREKKILKKLFENEKLNKLLSDFSNDKDEENKSSENKILDDKRKSQKTETLFNFLNKNIKLIKTLKHVSLKKFHDFYKNVFDKEFLKPGEYINFIANKIFKDIASFRNKKYNDNIKRETIKNKNYSNIININEYTDLNKERFLNHYLALKSKGKTSKFNMFQFQQNLNINNKKNIKNSNSTSLIKNNTSIQNIIRNNENIKSSFDENKKIIQTQKNNNNDEEIKKDSINIKNKSKGNNKIKSLKKKIFNKKARKKINKKIKSLSKEKTTSNIKIIENNKIDENKENTEAKNIKENIENEEIEEEKDLYEDTMEDEEEDDNYDYSNRENITDKDRTLIRRNSKLKHSYLFNKNININEEDKKAKKIKRKKKIVEEVLDKLYEFKDYKLVDDHLILDDLDKIHIEKDLKIKLKENMKQVIILIKKEKKTKYDYMRLHICQKRIKYLIKKLAEKDTQKTLVNKPQKDLTFPEDIEERKKLYRLMRLIEEQIREELQKNEEYEYDESDSFSENDKSIDNKKIYEFLPIEEEKKHSRRRSMFDFPEKIKKNLIYDNLYLYHNDEEKQPVEIKKEIYDILNKDLSKENEEKIEEKEKEVINPRRFTIRRKKFRKTRKQTKLIRLKDEEAEEENKEEKKEVITLDNKINDFFEKIKKLKEASVDEVDYDNILDELLWNRKEDNLMEENMKKEIRLLNFFRYFKTIRKMDLIRKKYNRDKYAFNPPINFRNNHK